jgi:hypothetical protein
MGKALIQLERVPRPVVSQPWLFVTTLSEQVRRNRGSKVRSGTYRVAMRAKVSSKDIVDMRQRLRDLERVAAKRDQRAYISKDYAFHVAIGR